MEHVNAKISKPPSRRLLFDRRYGWVVDEWKHPSEEALTGGRGMFCILPLSKALLKTTSESVNFAVSAAKNLVQRQDPLSSEVLQACTNDWIHELNSLFQNPKSQEKPVSIRVDSTSNLDGFSLHVDTERRE